MSDSKNPKPLPPDDFSSTTPNIKVPKPDAPSYGNEPSNDWEKTNYNYSPKDLQQEDWNKTSYNTPKPSSNKPSDYNNPYSQNPPGNAPKADEWGMTQANINIPFNQPNQSEQPVQEDFGARQPDHGATTPFIYLPENEKAKYQNPEPPKTKVEEQEEEAEKKGGIPSWLWTVGGLLTMFFFAVAVLLIVYFFFFNKTGFEVVVKHNLSQTQMDVLVDSAYWGVTSEDGTIRLQGLRAGTRKIEIKAPNFKCESENVIGADGEKKEVTAKCSNAAAGGFEVLLRNAPPRSEVLIDGTNSGVTGEDGTLKLQGLKGNKKVEIRNPDFKCDVQDVSGTDGEKKELSARCTSATVPDDCLKIKKGEYDKAAKCAYDELDKLEKSESAGKMYTVEQLLYAMNLYIINFDSGKFNIKPKDMAFVNRASGFIKKLPANTVIEVGGHTDNVGKDVKNQPLSENRAKSVQNELLKLGITPTMLRTKGYGSKSPREPNETEDGKFRNRRIEYTVISK